MRQINIFTVTLKITPYKKRIFSLLGLLPLLARNPKTMKLEQMEYLGFTFMQPQKNAI